MLPGKAKKILHQPRKLIQKFKKWNSDVLLNAVHLCAQLWVNLWVTVNKTYFSLSPSHLETRSDEEMEKKVELFASVATALAR